MCPAENDKSETSALSILNCRLLALRGAFVSRHAGANVEYLLNG